MFVYVVFRVEFEFEIRFCMAPQKPGKNLEKRDVRAMSFFSGDQRTYFFIRAVGAPTLLL